MVICWPSLKIVSEGSSAYMVADTKKYKSTFDIPNWNHKIIYLPNLARRVLAWFSFNTDPTAQHSIKDGRCY
jgi:hypothetical protein